MVYLGGSVSRLSPEENAGIICVVRKRKGSGLPLPFLDCEMLLHLLLHKLLHSHLKFFEL